MQFDTLQQLDHLTQVFKEVILILLWILSHFFCFVFYMPEVKLQTYYGMAFICQLAAFCAVNNPKSF